MAAAQPHRGASLHGLAAFGQSVWIDFLSRDLLRSGGLHSLISAGISGVTTNPTILAQAITGSDTYDDQIKDLAVARIDADATFRELAATDVAAACDVLAAVWQGTDGRDGFVSWEVDPALADRAQETMKEAASQLRRIGRPNLLVKIPATAAGVEAFEEATAAGFSVNVTLIFTLERYGQVLAAYARGLARAAGSGHDLTTIQSVASFFVSRLDTVADERLDALGTPAALALRGRLGISSAKLAYRMYWEAHTSRRWQALEDLGARSQRCLWASTGTKNPSYGDVMYVEELIGPSTVTTLPATTLEAFLDHGYAAPTLVDGVEEAARHLIRLRTLGIDPVAIGTQLERNGFERFRRSQDEAVASVAASLARLRSVRRVPTQ